MRIEEDPLIKRLQELARQVGAGQRTDLFALVRDFYMSGICSGLNKKPDDVESFERYKTYFLKEVGLGAETHLEMISRDVCSAQYLF